ncbi:MAG: response regulator transcription factor [Hyphomicrobiales bacterium]|nr:response regulator transcription factor [Hyphomicrobiales bacterium]
MIAVAKSLPQSIETTGAIRTTGAIETIETSGGWRLVLQGRMALFENASAHLRPDHMLTCPNAYLAVAFYLARRSEAQTARAMFDEVQSALNTGRLKGHDGLEAELELVGTHIRCYEDYPMGEDELKSLEALLSVLSADDQVGRGLVLNYLCFMSLHQGNFNFSQSYAENAIRAYIDGGADFGALHLDTYLGQIRLARGDLVGADEQYWSMLEKLKQIRPAQPELISVCQALQSEVAYEMNEIERSDALLTSALRLVENDAWFDILAAGYRSSTRLAMLHDGLPGALSALDHAETIAARRAMPRLHRLIQIEKIRALTLNDELDLARDEIWKAGLNRFIDAPEWDGESDWAIRLGPTAVALARFLIRDRRADKALVVLNSAEDNAIRSGHMLAVAKLRVIRAMALWRLRQRKESAGALISGIRLLGNQPFRRFILDEGPRLQEIVQAVLDRANLGSGSNQFVSRRLKELNHLWTLELQKPGRRRSGATNTTSATGATTASHGPGRQQYLQLLAIGQSNKEIGRALGVSQNTVKYHLKVLFRELGVDNRVRAVNRARELNLL